MIMRPLRLHFILGYAMLGAIFPFLPEFLRSDRGLDARQIGSVFAASQVWVMIAPVVLTYLADRMVSPRAIAVFLFALSAAAFAGLSQVSGFWPTMLLCVAFGFPFAALAPLMDGLYFGVQRRRAASGLSMPPYHRIRVLGTLGFILPSLGLPLLIPAAGSLEVIMPVAAILAFAALLNGATLPDPRLRELDTGGRRRAPTLEALRVLLSRRTLAFCAAMAMLQVAQAGYYVFYPVHLVQSLEVEARWLGLISTLGVASEVPFMLAFAWISARLGSRNMLGLGALLTALRLALVALAPSAWVAIAANGLHGPIILFSLVAPVIFLNNLAGDSFRNSIQGVFTVAVSGPARIGGNLLCGWLASFDTRLAFAAGVVLALGAAALFFALVRNPEKTPDA